MNVRDAMTPGPATCDVSTSLRLVAQLMATHECAAIPVTDSGRLVGIITDRDITCRAVATRINAPELPASACMSSPVLAIRADEPLDRAIALMEENAIHHLPVLDQRGQLVGILAQSDLGRRMTNREFGALARMTSIRARYGRSFAHALVKREH